MWDKHHLEEGDPLKPTRYLVINPNGTFAEYDQPLGVLDAQEVVGGDIEMMPTPRDVNVTVLANEEGKRLGLDANWKATALIRSHLRPTDFVAGNVIVAGPADPDGELSSLSDEDISTIKELTDR